MRNEAQSKFLMTESTSRERISSQLLASGQCAHRASLVRVLRGLSANRKLSRNGVPGNEGGTAPESVDFSQPTTQPTICDVLYDFRVVWQSPRSCKLL